jgi:hypothetical protein
MEGGLFYFQFWTLNSGPPCEPCPTWGLSHKYARVSKGKTIFIGGGGDSFQLISIILDRLSSFLRVPVKT